MTPYSDTKQFKVRVSGEVVVEADTSAEAVTKASAYFVSTGQKLVWSWEELAVTKEVSV